MQNDFLTYYQFGKFLLSTYDLDPLYAILAESNMPERTLKRFLLAYWVFYSAGVAACIAEIEKPSDYWKMMYTGDAHHWPRGHERRHMRGQAFQNCLMDMRSYGTPETVVDLMTVGNNFEAIGRGVRQFCGFGPWIAWKVADMTERVLCKPVDFSNAELAVYRDPVKGAALIKFGDQKHPITTEELHQVVEGLIHDFRHFKAPPYQDRPINIQEVETILCKYKSYINGHYPPGLDTRDIYEGLEGWGDLARQLQHLLRPYHQLVGEK